MVEWQVVAKNDVCMKLVLQIHMYQHVGLGAEKKLHESVESGESVATFSSARSKHLLLQLGLSVRRQDCTSFSPLNRRVAMLFHAFPCS